ncbi:DUF2252 domain-containing protein [Yinghuangia seranimata]|uniref:DUF2252 domain-containing protein n=1 Tax=Yinghuangia seranimata TaxID=408067 RepID=UPI00248C1CC5|nr:DUF2252 domain-containing protein [Yinghuangia seranimata]MDI2131293.1 DUF2252 domain-containing protein [Yinghuangia seranimata]
MAATPTAGIGIDAHPTPDERAARGRAARKAVPRSSHAEYQAPRDRFDPVDVLEEQSARRVQELVPLRYGRMTESPFRFYRGAAAIMAGDLSHTPQSGIRAQLCGDAHLLNFRLLGSPERHLLFDINDFDETLPGPWEWDVKRLSASLVIAGRANGFDDGERGTIVRSTVKAYREWMARFAGMPNLDVWYSQIDLDRLQQLMLRKLGKRERERVTKAAEKARRRDNLQVFEKLTEVVDGRRRIASDPPLLEPVRELLSDHDAEQLSGRITELIARYSQSIPSDRRELLGQFRVVDMARKVVGVGSVGTRCWIVLLLGRDDQDPLFLQAKEADTSVLAPYCGASQYDQQGERVVAGQRMMQAASDIFLGFERVQGIDNQQRDFYVRQLRDWKWIATPETMDPGELAEFGQACGANLARAHARSGDRIAIAAYLGSSDSFDRALATFAESYADQNERDHQALLDAIASGRLPAEKGV